MLYSNIPEISNFPHDGRLWRVDWFGQVTRASHKELEPNIEVQLSPFVGNPKYPVAKDSVANKEKIIVPIGVGLLPYVFIGSIWKNRSLQSMSLYKYIEEKEQIEFADHSMKIMRPIDNVNGQSLISDSYHVIAPGSGLEARCLTVSHRGIPAYLIIPQIELIRFYYFASGELAISLFNGILQNSSSLFDPKNEEDHNSQGSFAFDLPNEYHKSDTRILARIAASNIARRNAAKIHQSLMIHSANKEYGHPATYPPFIGRTRLKVYGKRIRSGGHWRFLVCWIDSCSGKFPFSSLIAMSDKIPAEVSNNPDEKTNNANTEETVRRTSAKQTIQKGSKIDPSIDTRSAKPDLEILFNRERFTNFTKERVVFRSKKPKVSEPTKVVAGTKKKKAKGKLATGTGSSGDDAAGKIVFGEESEIHPEVFATPSLPQLLRQMYDGLYQLQKDHPNDFSFKLITVTDEVFNHDIGPIQKVPRHRNETRLRWAFCDKKDEKWVQRQILIAEALYKNRYFYFFEAERRLKKDEDGNSTKEDAQKFTALMVYNRDFGKVDKNDLVDVVLACATRGYLFPEKDELAHLRRDQVRHRGWASPELRASRLKRKMDSVIPRKKKEKKKRQQESSDIED